MFFVKEKSSLKFIDTATVPVIKLQIDLQKVIDPNYKKQNPEAFETQEVTIEPVMRFLGIDITFEDSPKQREF